MLTGYINIFRFSKQLRCKDKPYILLKKTFIKQFLGVFKHVFKFFGGESLCKRFSCLGLLTDTKQFINKVK